MYELTSTTEKMATGPPFTFFFYFHFNGYLKYEREIITGRMRCDEY